MGEPETSLRQIEVVPATTEQEPVLANMLELYAHDFSEFSDLKIGVDGRFGYEPLPIRIDNFIFESWNHERKDDVLKKVVGDFTSWNRSAMKYEIAF